MTVKKTPFRLLLVVLLLIIGIVGPLATLRAQQQPAVLSIAMPEYVAGNLPQDAFKAFEAANPGVKVNLVKSGNDMYFAPAAYDSEKYFDSASKYAASADVLYVSSFNLSVEMTRAGYILDLSPLVNADGALNTGDFVPAVWQSFQWDRGVWALPVIADVFILSYDPAAFDKAELPYPDGKWTLDDLANAARKLTQKDSEGKVTLPGILAWNSGPLFRSLLGEGFYDPSVSPNPPQFDKPKLEALLEVWGKLQAEGITGNTFQGDWNTVPMAINQSFSIAQMGGENKPRRGALLPGGKAGLSVDGFAVSGGTQSPDLAYALAKFMTSDPRLVRSFFGITPARKSLLESYKSSDGARYMPKFTPENQAVIDQALTNAMPASETRYIDYVNKALSESVDKKTDLHSALQQAQTNALSVLKTAAEKRSVKALTVATPVPTPVLKAGEVSLKFTLVAYISPLPNKSEWEKLIQEFTSSDPQVKHITFETGFGGSLNDLFDKSDCFALPFNMVSYNDLSKLLSLDPLIDADKTFDKRDVIGNALTQLQRDGKTWGMPLYLQPQILRYNAELFTKAGIKLPENGWTVDAFNDALKALKLNPADPAPFVPRQFGSNYLMMLMAAYGGLPLDVRTNPATINFTDPAAVEAMRQVLDLAKKGYIKYEKLAKMGGGGGFGGSITDPIYTDSLSLLSFRGMASPEGKDPYKLINYPKGTKFTPLAYDVGAAYISAKASNPEGCYRWIAAIAKRPDLFLAMPARRSLLDTPGTASQGADVAAVYKQISALAQDPTALLMQSQNSEGTYVIQYILNRVFDGYVLDNKDLEPELKQAETFAKAYQSCIAKIPPNTAKTDQEMQAYFKQFTDCAIQLDPSLKSVFSPEQ